MQPYPLEFRGSQRAGLVPYCVRYSEAPKIVHQTGAAEPLALIGGQPVVARRSLRQLGDATRVSKRVRRFQIDKVSDRLQCRVELVVRHEHGQPRFIRDHRIPRCNRIQLVEQPRRHRAEGIDQRRVELRAASLARHRDRRGQSAGPMAELHDVGEIDDPRRDHDLLGPRAGRRPFAVPALEGLRDASLNPFTQAELTGNLGGGEAMALHRLLLPPAPSGSEQLGAELRAFDERSALAEVRQHEPGPGCRTGEVDPPDACLQFEIVAEPFRLLVGIDVTPDPRQQCRVVHDDAVRHVDTHPIGQPNRDQALAQHVLHRQTHAKIRSERQRGQQLRQPHPLASGQRTHEVNIFPLTGADGILAGASPIPARRRRTRCRPGQPSPPT